ncbi:MAG: phage scaffolding protein [Clostridia bacterium]|nr:phage scaffolding protein [Clostridia bacterium]
MYEYLKKLFGTKEDGTPEALTFEELTKKLGEAKDVKLANLADGGYVSKEKFDSKETELTGVKTQLADANKEIQSYKDMDIEKIKQAAADWEKKYNDETAALNQKIADNERAYNRELFFRDYKFTSKAAADGVKAEFDKHNFTFENGKFLGAEEFIKDLMANDDYKAAFAVEEPAPEPKPEPQPQPANRPYFAPQTPPAGKPKPKMGLAELMKLKNADPNAVITYD